MKLILFVVAVAVLLWLLRRSISRVLPPRRQAPGSPPPAQSILACAECGLHLPQGDALPGRGGVFCSEAHRLAFEQAHPGR